MIGIRVLTRSFIGARAFLALFDQCFRDNNSQAVIGIIEVDLNQNISLIYIAPNYTLNLIRFTDYENTNNSQTDEEEETQPHRNSSAFMNKIIEEDETMTYLC